MIFDTSIFLGEFEAEARLHIEKIETAFLDISEFSKDIKLINSVFRAAHSIKGTAGFLSLKKIVAVTHELENILSQLKDDITEINDEIADIILQSVDCLKELIDNLNNDDEICINEIIYTLKRYNFKNDTDNKEKQSASHLESNGTASGLELQIPFNIKEEPTENALKNAIKRGHKIYSVNIDFNRSLGKYYKNPRGMIENIFSVGSILQAIVNGSKEKTFKNTNNAVFTDNLTDALKEHDTSTLEILASSVLEQNLFSMAIAVDISQISHLSKEMLFGEDNEEKTITANPAILIQNKKNIKPSRDHNISIRLDITEINRIMDLANELILTRNQLFSAVTDYKKSIPGFAPLLHDINHLISDIHEKIMFTRMQPISVIFSKFPRIIRDTAKILNKEITVNILRDYITLDKYLLEELTDPITQLVKNSADHGMETAQQRITAGKPQKGTITLDAYMRDGLAIIEVIDDGAGIDIETLKNKALENKIASKETLDSLPKKEVLNLIFNPGISTAKQVTNLSGRGIGMDIVKTNIEKSGGSIEVESEPGLGTTIRLKMPLTLSVINTLIVNIDSIFYAVPELNVEHIVRICKNSFSIRLEKINKSLALIYNGQIIPVVTMDEIEAKAKNTNKVSADEVLERCHASNVIKCLVLKADGKRFALLIDNALDTEQVLVKHLPIYLQNCPCYLSVTVLGNGNAVTILDAAGIMRFMGLEDIENKTLQLFSEAEDKYIKTGDEKQILIFKCSGKEYFSVYMNDISRIERIKAKDIQEINGEYFINITGVTFRIERPENFTPVEKQDYTENRLYLLILKNALPMGLLVKNVIDKCDEVFYLENKHIYSDFIFGTGVYNEKILIFLNPAAIIEYTEKEKIKNKIIYNGGTENA
ncbi:MAG: chemotaxis protein CheA [Treponema sp.]|nr:chemotaxis protein CheA [Treponema sp.]